MPAVGRYRTVCREGTVSGSLRRIVWKLGDSEGITVLKVVREVCHMTMVPPLALTLSMARLEVLEFR